MENRAIFSTNIIGEIFPGLLGLYEYYELNTKMRKRNNLSKSIIEIVDKLSEEDLFKNVDKVRLFKFLYSRIHILPYDIKKDELNRRIRKIMAVEAMSRILDGLSPEQVEDLVRSFK